MNYAEISKATISLLHASYASLKNSPLKRQLRILLELRVSQINGCSYCCNLHYAEAEEANIDRCKINELGNWKNSPNFTEAERVALFWAESLTLPEKHLKVSDTKLNLYFSEREIVDITACVSIMNALNRLAIAMRGS